MMIESNEEKVLHAAQGNNFDNKLRPKSINEYIGQESVKDVLKIGIEAAKKRGDCLDHILLHGPPGLGKTTLAYILANELGSAIKVTSGPALEKQGDLAAIISNLNESDVLFIDEIHRLKAPIEEILYSAMEDFALDIVIGKGPSARSMRIEVPKFTLIGATTKMSMISSPLRDRFGNVLKLRFYEQEHVKEIIKRSSKILGCDIQEEAAVFLAKSSRKTPRIANRLLKRVRDYAEVHNKALIDLELLQMSLNSMGIDKFGLDESDRSLLSVIIDKFQGGPVGLSTLSAAIMEERATIEDIYEPYLMQLGFLERTARGRIATKLAYEHLNIELPA